MTDLPPSGTACGELFDFTFCFPFASFPEFTSFFSFLFRGWGDGLSLDPTVDLDWRSFPYMAEDQTLTPGCSAPKVVPRQHELPAGGERGRGGTEACADAGGRGQRRKWQPPTAESLLCAGTLLTPLSPHSLVRKALRRGGNEAVRSNLAQGHTDSKEPVCGLNHQPYCAFLKNQQPPTGWGTLTALSLTSQSRKTPSWPAVPVNK